MIGVAGAGWIYFAILYARWAREIGVPSTASWSEKVELKIRFLSATDPSDGVNEARAARAAARRMFFRVAGFSVVAIVAEWILIALLALQD